MREISVEALAEISPRYRSFEMTVVFLFFKQKATASLLWLFGYM